MEPFISFLLNITINMPTEVHLEPNISTRVVNGYKVNITEVPYHAVIHGRENILWYYVCGAVIIHEKATLTAAHCIDQLLDYISEYSGNKTIDITKYMRISVGGSLIHTGGDYYTVSKVVKHQDYPKNHLQSDIAFIVLARNIKFNERVKFIPHAPKNYKISDGTEAIVSGFGSTSFGAPFSRTLLATKVYITNQKLCARAYNSYSSSVTITHRVICANATKPPRDSCLGDSGGPLVADGYLIGIVSFGVECAHPIYPGVYTRVSHYYDWIEKNLVDNKLTTKN